jgi:hypothetical protein
MIHLIGLFGQAWACANSGKAKQKAIALRRIQETLCFGSVMGCMVVSLAKDVFWPLIKALCCAQT